MSTKNKKGVGGLCHCSETFSPIFFLRGSLGVTGKLCFLQMKCFPSDSQNNSGILEKSQAIKTQS